MSKDTIVQKMRDFHWLAWILCIVLAAMGFTFSTPKQRLAKVEKAIVAQVARDSTQDATLAEHIRQGEEAKRAFTDVLDALALERCTVVKDVVVRSKLKCGQRLSDAGVR